MHIPSVSSDNERPSGSLGGDRAVQALLLAALLAGLSFVAPLPEMVLVLRSAAGALAVVAGGVKGVTLLRSRRQTRSAPALAAFVEQDASPSLTTDADGLVLSANRAARARFEQAVGLPLVQALREHWANPGPVIARLQDRALSQGSAREDVVTRRGHFRLSVHQAGNDSYLWRMEEMVERPLPGAPGSDTISLPMMTLGQSGAILYMNEPLRRLVGTRARRLDALFTDLPLRPDGVHELTTPEGPVPVRVLEAGGTGMRREVYLFPVPTPLRPAAAPADTRAPAAQSVSRAFETIPVALLRLSADGGVTIANRMARDLLGARQLEGMVLPDLVEGMGRSVRDWLEEAVAGRGTGKHEVVRATLPEKEVFLQISLQRVLEEGEVSLVAVLNDATELKTLEAQFVQSQKMQAIGQLAGGVAHDFNNLLTAISGHCDLLLLRHDAADPDYGDLIQINQNANRAASLVGQLLAFSRKQNLQPEVLDMRDTLSDLTHLLNRLVGERVSLVLQHDPGLRPVRADKRQLEQVVMNLVVNARDAMPEGGEVRIETEACTLRDPMARDQVVVPPGDYVVVRVVDEGCGIAPEKITKIFEPFYSTKRVGEGTGLGLSTAYGIVKQTGGYIFADSVVGAGTTFTLLFPAYDQPVAETVPQPAAPRAPVLTDGDGVILLVEDEAPVRAFASRALRMRGYTVIEAENAEEALRTLEDETLHIDVFVTDVIMPGLDGPTWVRKALDRRPGAKVVFVSGYAEDSFSDQQARIPNSVFLPKPFSLTQLTATVQEQLAP